MSRNQKYTEGHGSNWAAFGFDPDDVSIVSIINKAVSDSKAKILRGKKFLGMLSFSPPTQILSVLEPHEDANTLITAYPFLNISAPKKIQLQKINEWGNGAEAVLTGYSEEHRTEFSFFDTTYFKNKLNYKIGEKYVFHLAALAQSFKSRTDSMKLNPKSGPLKGQTVFTHMMKVFASDNTYPEIYNFYFPYLEFEKQHKFENKIIFEYNFEFDSEDNIGPKYSLPIFVHETVLGDYQPVAGDAVTGFAWLQGYLDGSLVSNEKRVLNKSTTKKVWQPTPRGVGKWKVSGQDLVDALNRSSLKSPSPEEVAAASAKLDDTTRESIFRGLKGKYVDGRSRKISLDPAARMDAAVVRNLTQRALDIVYSSTRTKPAHYSSNGERTQSFCVDFPPLTAEDDFAMADSVMSYMVTTPKEGVSEERVSLVLKCGEDIMLGSYVIAKQGHPELTNEVARALLFTHDFNFRKPSRWQSKDPLFFEKWTKPYFAFCEEFGRHVATK